jgi:hypothetical protein
MSTVPLPGEWIPIWGTYLKMLRVYELPTKTLTSGVVLSGGQWLAQHITGQKDSE